MAPPVEALEVSCVVCVVATGVVCVSQVARE